MNTETCRGVVPPIVTPLTAEGDLDADGLQRLVDFQIEAGVDGIFVLGSTGEAYRLDTEQRRELVERTAAAVNGRVPLYVGVGDITPARTLANAEHAANAGAGYAVLITPTMLRHSDAELVRYFAELAPRMPLPVLAYNIPQVACNALSPDAIAQLMDLDNLAGLKDSEGSVAKSGGMLARLHAHPHFRWFEGQDALSAQSLLMGAHGVVNGGCNLFPHLYVALYAACRERKLDDVHRLQTRLRQALALFDLAGGDNPFFGSFLKTTKYGLQLLGVCQEHASWPYTPLDAEQKRAIERRLGELSE